MTKINDLVSVQVDNAFRQFPIDKERYELLDLVRCFLIKQQKFDLEIAADYMEDGLLLGAEDLGRQTEFLCGVLGNVILASQSVYTVVVQDPRIGRDENHPCRDRARRLLASLPESWTRRFTLRSHTEGNLHVIEDMIYVTMATFYVRLMFPDLDWKIWIGAFSEIHRLADWVEGVALEHVVS